MSYPGEEGPKDGASVAAPVAFDEPPPFGRPPSSAAGAQASPFLRMVMPTKPPTLHHYPHFPGRVLVSPAQSSSSDPRATFPPKRDVSPHRRHLSTFSPFHVSTFHDVRNMPLTLSPASGRHRLPPLRPGAQGVKKSRAPVLPPDAGAATGQPSGGASMGDDPEAVAVGSLDDADWVVWGELPEDDMKDAPEEEEGELGVTKPQQPRSPEDKDKFVPLTSSSSELGASGAVGGLSQYYSPEVVPHLVAATSILHKYARVWAAKKSLAALRSRRKTRQHVCTELLNTERIYVENLRLIEVVWQKPLLELVVGKKKLVSQADYNAIFGTGFTMIRNINLTFLKSLEGCLFSREAYQDTALVSKQILRMAPYFKMYRTYTSGNEKAIATWSRLKTVPSIRSILSDWEKDARTSKLGLFSYLIQPIQRIVRYRLLLRDLLKCTEPDHPDYSGLQLGLTQISSVADFLNTAIAEMKASEDLKAIQARLQPSSADDFEIIQPRRKLVRFGVGTLGITSKKTKTKAASVTMVLFNDCLLQLAHGRGDTLRYATHLDLDVAVSRGSIKVFTSAKYPGSVKVVGKKKQSMIFSFVKEGEAGEWRDAIADVLLEQRKRDTGLLRDPSVTAIADGTVHCAMRSELAMSDEECVEFVKNNRRSIVQYSSARGGLKLVFRDFIVDRQETKLVWLREGSEEEKGSLQLRRVISLTIGQQTTMFKKFPKADLNGLSFSLLHGAGHWTGDGVWTGPTLDLICRTKLEFQIWTHALTFLLKDGGQTTAKRNAAIGSGSKPKAALAVDHDTNDLYSWGKGEAGAPGHGDVEDVKTPRILRDFMYLDVEDVSLGDAATFAVVKNGRAFAWGDGKAGRLGLGNTATYHSPTALRGPLDCPCAQIAVDETHMLFLDSSGRVFVCGSQKNGQLGLGVEDGKVILEPKCLKLEGIGRKKVVFVACGTGFSGCVTETGEVFMFGSNRDGQCGTGSVSESVATPALLTQFGGKTPCTALALGCSHSLALTSDRDVYSWGDSTDGQLGNGHMGKGVRSTTPEILRSAFIKRKTKAIAAGAFHSAAVTVRGKIYLWGQGINGQLGTGKTESTKYPTLLTQFIEYPCRGIACGSMHNVALLEEHQKDASVKTHVISWGAGMYGRLGLGSEANQLSPVLVRRLEGKSVKKVVAGGCLSAAVVTHSWLPDKDVPSCMGKVCGGVRFGLRKRRHHCRNCGGVFCGECSKKRISLVQFGLLDPQRVCDTCSRILSPKQM